MQVASCKLHHESCMELLPVEFVIGDFLKCEFTRFEVEGRGGQGGSQITEFHSQVQK